MTSQKEKILEEEEEEEEVVAEAETGKEELAAAVEVEVVRVMGVDEADEAEGEEDEVAGGAAETKQESKFLVACLCKTQDVTLQTNQLQFVISANPCPQAIELSA